MAGRVVIASSDPGLKGLLGPLLEAAGYQPVFAASVEEAAKQLGESPPELIVLDRDQPQGQSALVFLRRLLADGMQAPIVIASAGASVEDLLAGFRLGAVEVIRKPPRPGVVKAVLSRVLSKNKRDA